MNKNKGFTLIEVIVASFLITVGAVGAMAGMQALFAVPQTAEADLIASYLAQEGVEIVRNIRDGNWLQQRTSPSVLWDDGLSSGSWEADYSSQSLSVAFVATFLNIDAAGFYGYGVGTPTKFQRKISIAKPGEDQLQVSVQVLWQERGKSFEVSAEESLYNWLKR